MTDSTGSMDRIADVRCEFLRYPFPADVKYVYSGGVVENMDVALIRVTSQTGVHGLGEVTHGQFCYEPVVGLTQHFARILRGRPVCDINGAWDAMYESSVFWNRQGIGIGVMGGIDIALHDLAGKLLGVPVYQLLGGRVRSRIRIYASNGLFDDEEPLIADALKARAAGFDAYKMRVVSPTTVVKLVAALRESVGESMDIIVDAVQGSCAIPWSVAISKALARELEPFGILWLEEPVRVEDLEGYAEVKRATSINVAGAESIPTALAFKPYLENDVLDIVQFDIATSGFTEGRRIATLAALHRKPVAIHSWGSIVSIMAGVHMGLATPNCAITEYGFLDQPINRHLVDELPLPQQGHIGVNANVPGLGVAYDEKTRELFPYEPSINTMITYEEKDLLL